MAQFPIWRFAFGGTSEDNRFFGDATICPRLHHSLAEPIMAKNTEMDRKRKYATLTEVRTDKISPRMFERHVVLLDILNGGLRYERQICQ